MSPWQFLTLSTVVAIAILGGGLWLLRHFMLRHDTATQTAAPITQVEASAPEFTLPDTSAPLTTELLPSIALDRPNQVKNITVQKIWQYRYNVALLPNWVYSQDLQTIIDGIKTLATDANLPVTEMSVVLIDLNQGAIAYHQPELPHYPASIAKLFWMAALYGQFQQGLLNEADFQEDLKLMVQRSDNNAASHIVDAITRTTFQAKGSPEAYQAWSLQREQLNLFFTLAGYQNLNVTQKTYPIPDIKVEEPLGFDLQMRYDPNNPNQPIRNQLSAWHAARLMYEIASQQAIAPDASQKMLKLLRRDLRQNWQTPTNFFNPVQHFFGAGLPPETDFYSKAGWTTQGRHEVAYIASPDGTQKYILSIFADHVSYAENRTFFPEVAKFVSQKIATIPASEKQNP